MSVTARSFRARSGVNPLLTITAICERAMIHLGRDLDRPFDDKAMIGAPVRLAGAADDAVADIIGVGIY